MATMNVSLPDAMKDWVEEQVAGGQYANVSDYVRDLIREEQRREEARLEFDDMIEQALASGTVQITREELVARMQVKRAEALRSRKSA